MNKGAKQKTIPWHEAEKKITEEIKWLKKSILPSPFKNEDSPIKCLDCLYREIAIMIVRGDIKVKEFTKLDWKVNDGEKLPAKSKHGKEWHKNMMNKLDKYFSSQKYKVEQEPAIGFGRADLGIYKKNEKDILIEVGTISVYKLLFNLQTMHNAVFLLVPKDNYAIEFEV